MNEGKLIQRKAVWILLIFLVFHYLQRNVIDLFRDPLIKNGAPGLIIPVLLVVQFGIVLPVLLKITGIKFNEIGFNTRNLKEGFLLSVKYFLWIVCLGYIVAFLQAFPFNTNVEVHPWTGLRFIDLCYQKFIEILISPVLWEETIARGLFLAYLIKIGLDKPFRRMKANQAIFISSIFFSLMHVQNFLKIKSPEQIAYALVYLAGGVLVGYMLAMIRKKADSLFWPIIMHTFANFGEWAIKILIPIVIKNQFL